MVTEGKVILVSENEVTVSVIRKGSCGDNCAACKACKNSDVTVTAYCEYSVNVGDTVTLNTESKYVYIGLVAIFLLPVVLPLFIYLLFYKAVKWLLITLVSVAFAVSIISVYFLSKSRKYLNKVKPKVTNVNTN